MIRVDGRYIRWVAGTCRDKDCPLPVSEAAIWCKRHHQQFLNRLSGRLAELAGGPSGAELEVQEWLERMLTNRRRGLHDVPIKQC